MILDLNNKNVGFRLICWALVLVFSSSVSPAFAAVPVLWAAVNKEVLEENYQIPVLNTTITQAVANLDDSCQDYKADTQSEHYLELKDHHQSQTMSHRFSDGTHLILLSHSEMEGNDQGQLLAFQLGSNMYDESNDIINNNLTMSMKSKVLISEKHPSGIEWLVPPNSPDWGYLITAAEEENQVRVDRFTSTGAHSYIGAFSPKELSEITDIWIVDRGYDHWIILHDMNGQQGEAWRAPTYALFQYATENEGTINLSALRWHNDYTTPETGCDKGLGQNAMVVKDSSDQWYVVHSYTEGNNLTFGDCGVNDGKNVVKAWQASFAGGKFQIVDPHLTEHDYVAQKNVGRSGSWLYAGADGAAGFRVNKQGRLVAFMGAQYAQPDPFDFKSSLRECRAP